MGYELADNPWPAVTFSAKGLLVGSRAARLGLSLLAWD